MPRFRYFWNDKASSFMVGKKFFKLGERVPETQVPHDRLEYFVETGQMLKKQVKEAPPTPQPVAVEPPTPQPKKRGRPPKGGNK